MARNRRNDPESYGSKYSRIRVDEADQHFVDPTEVRRLVWSTLTSPGYRPPVLPVAALEVNRLSRSPDVTFDALVKVLEQDQVLASDVLRIAQSPLFLRRVPPATLTAAVSRLGLEKIRDIVFEVAFGARVFRAPGYDKLMESVRKHSVACAHIARMISSGKAPEVQGYAFLCGLMHDVGAAAVVLALAQSGKRVGPETLSGVINELHEEAGQLLLNAWKLPETLKPAIMEHHVPQTKVGALVHVSHAIASSLGCGIKVDDYAIESHEDATDQLFRACKLLGLSDRGLARVRHDAAALLKTV